MSPFEYRENEENEELESPKALPLGCTSNAQI